MSPSQYFVLAYIYIYVAGICTSLYICIMYLYMYIVYNYVIMCVLCAYSVYPPMMSCLSGPNVVLKATEWLV